VSKYITAMDEEAISFYLPIMVSVYQIINTTHLSFISTQSLNRK